MVRGGKIRWSGGMDNKLKLLTAFVIAKLIESIIKIKLDNLLNIFRASIILIVCSF